MATKFTTMTFDKMCASIMRREGVLVDDIQTAIATAFDYAINKDDFDAPARLLNALRKSLGRARTVAEYMKAHGPLSIEYKTDPKTKLKRFYCSKNKDGGKFLNLDKTWYEWDNPRQEAKLRDVSGFMQYIERAAADTEHKQNDPKVVELAQYLLADANKYVKTGGKDGVIIEKDGPVPAKQTA